MSKKTRKEFRKAIKEAEIELALEQADDLWDQELLGGPWEDDWDYWYPEDCQIEYDGEWVWPDEAFFREVLKIEEE